MPPTKEEQLAARKLAEVEQRKKSLIGKKGWFTRCENEAKAYSNVALLESRPSTTLLASLNQLVKDIQSRCNEYVRVGQDLCVLYTELEDDEALERQRNDNSVICDRKGVTTTLLLNAIGVVEAALHGDNAILGTPPAPAVIGEPKSRTETALKPKLLTLSYTPLELTVWLKDFDDFYRGSRLSEAPLERQQALFRSCLDTHLKNRLDSKIQPGTNVLIDPRNPDDDSCIGFLREEFLTEYPLFTRRLQYYQFKQRTGQKYSDFYKRLKQMEDEACIQIMSNDELRVMRMLTACSDLELRRKFLEEEDRTEKNFLKVIQQHEIGKKYAKAMDNTTSANSIHPKRLLRKKSQNTAGRKKKQQPNYRVQLKKKGRGQGPRNTFSQKHQAKCNRCGRRCNNPNNHPDCRAKNASCHKCGKPGHLSPVCRSNAVRQQRKNGPNTARKSFGNKKRIAVKPGQRRRFVNANSAVSVNTVNAA